MITYPEPSRRIFNTVLDALQSVLLLDLYAVDTSPASALRPLLLDVGQIAPANVFPCSDKNFGATLRDRSSRPRRSIFPL